MCVCVCVCVVVQRADDAVSRRKKTDERTQDDKGGCCMLYMLGETHTHSHTLQLHTTPVVPTLSLRWCGVCPIASKAVSAIKVVVITCKLQENIVYTWYAVSVYKMHK